MRCLSLLILSLFAAAPIYAGRLNPLNDHFTITVGDTVLTQANASFDSLTGVVSFSDGIAVYTFEEADALPLIEALSVTRTCVTQSLDGCPSTVVAIFNARVLNGLPQASEEAGASVQDSGQAGVFKLVFISTMAGLEVQSALVGYSSSAVRAKPEIFKGASVRCNEPAIPARSSTVSAGPRHRPAANRNNESLRRSMILSNDSTGSYREVGLAE